MPDSASTTAVATPAPSRALLFLCIAALYIVWGSTYLAIKLGLETMPPFFMAGSRFLVAGLLLLGWLKFRGEPWPTGAQWVNGLKIGTLLLAIGNGGVVYAEQHVASGLAAVLIATVPVWAIVFSSFAGTRPSRSQWMGVFLGLAGVAVLNFEGQLRGNPVSTGVLVLAAASWAFGTVWSRRLDLPRGMGSSAVQMVGGGLVLLVASLLFRERFATAVSARSFGAWVFLVTFGSLLAFSAFVYLVRNTSAAVATSYAYVNPIVAVLLGVTLGSESLGAQVVFAMPLVLAGVVLVLRK